MVAEQGQSTDVKPSRASRPAPIDHFKTDFPSIKLFQSDLYDSIKRDGNHIVSLSQAQIRSFLIFAVLRHHAHQLHPKYAANLTIIIEPHKKLGEERERLIKNHTDFKVINLFKFNGFDPKADNSETKDRIDSSTQIVIGPIDRIIDNPGIINRDIKLVILDCAHELIVQDIKIVRTIVNHFNNEYPKSHPKPNILVFMSSFIHDNNELSPKDTVKLIKEFETLFAAKCETSGDLRSISRQSHSTPVKMLEFETSQLVLDEYSLLADEMLKQFCQFMTDPDLENTEPVIKPDPEIEDVIMERETEEPLLSVNEQLALVRSCLSDCLYSIHYLGLWCSKTLIKLYLTEFSRLLDNKQQVGDLIGAASSVLNTFYGRIESISDYYSERYGKDFVHKASSRNLRAALDTILEFKPQMKSSWPICIINVKRRVIAKVIALWLEKVSTNIPEYDFIKPNYIVDSSRKHRNRMAVDNFDLHHEAAVRDVRFGYCNVLVSSVVSNERSTDMPRCNLVISFDGPTQFSEFIQSKGNCRYDSSQYMIMVDKYMQPEATERMISYINMEKLLNEAADSKMDPENSMIINITLMETYDKLYPPYPTPESRNSVTLVKAIGIVNKYCAKLPSDSFTKLSHEWEIHDIIVNDGTKAYFCEIRLPVNSPVRQIIIGQAAPTKKLATRLAAYSACKLLHRQGELDDNMCPITKETFKTINVPPSAMAQREAGLSRLKLTNNNKTGNASGRPSTVDKNNISQSLGTTKHRQYYRKSIAQVFSGEPVSDKTQCYLYKFNMLLTCPIPEEQNRRGRRIVDPGETNRNYAIVCTSQLPKICTFPVFTRSGEVLISVELVKENFMLTKEQVDGLEAFHQFTFSKVLRLEKYPTKFDPKNSSFTVTLAPVIDDIDKDGLKTTRSEIDWKFVQQTVERCNDETKGPSVEQRKNFVFKHDDYVDAVVIPWYRQTERQQFAYYVAEICTDLTPRSKFPDKESGFDTFVDYYKTKYDMSIFNMDQPVLDVDHTSARLNLLTPRYVNRKGRTLPSSTAKSRRESRESLVQKQLLVPELCTIHPFPASFWRKAVCLPCIFYRLNSLYLAEELRRQVAREVGIGIVEPPSDFQWPNLDFGWSLKEVVQEANRSKEEQEQKPHSSSIKENDKEKQQDNQQKSSAISDIKPEPSGPTKQPVVDKTATNVKISKNTIKKKSSPPSDNKANAGGGSGCGRGGGSGASGGQTSGQKTNSSSTDDSNDSNDFVIDTFDPTKVDIPGWGNNKVIDDDGSSSHEESDSINQDDMGLVFLNPTKNIKEEWEMMNKSQANAGERNFRGSDKDASSSFSSSDKDDNVFANNQTSPESKSSVKNISTSDLDVTLATAATNITLADNIDNYDEDEDDDDDDFDNISCGNGFDKEKPFSFDNENIFIPTIVPEQSQLQTIIQQQQQELHRNASESKKGQNDNVDDEDDDESWSSPSSDHQANKLCTFGPWKDSKMKNQPLLREIFSPISRCNLRKENSHIRQLYEILINNHQMEDLESESINSALTLSKENDDNRSVLLESLMVNTKIEQIPDLVKLDPDCWDQQGQAENLGLINLMFKEDDDAFKPVKDATDSDKGKKHSREWLTIMQKLSQRVEIGLTRNPDLFSKGGLKLVSVDDSLYQTSKSLSSASSSGNNLSMSNNSTCSDLQQQPTFGELLPNRENQSHCWTNDDWKNLRFDPTTDEIKSMGPSPSVILQALTMSNASDGINLERLETVGDSFLKYSITAYLHCTQPLMHEGKLSYLRSTEISNANLYLLGRNKRLGELMSATKFEPNDNWLAPGYTVTTNSNNTQQQQQTSKTIKSLPCGDSSGDAIERPEIDRALAEVPYDLIQQHSIADKSIADCVEALIGAYLTSSGSRAALLFMHWLGLRVLPENFDLEAEIARTECPDTQRWHWLDTPKSPLICMQPYFDPQPLQQQSQANEKEHSTKEPDMDIDPHEVEIPNYVKPFMKTPDQIKDQAQEELMRLYHGNNLDKFEQQIQYTFRDKAFLVQAFTHNSFYENHVTDCHQRLEFLGDALLDYLITRYLFEDPRCHSPGTLTDLRSALVNNTFFASLAVKYKFHKYLQYISDELFQVIDGFVNKFRFDIKETITKGYTLLISEGESEYAEDIEVPKALGDVFESVAGAIYLDSGMSLDRVWQVYFRMMKPEIEYFSQNVPKSPIRELLESMPQNVRFSPSELAPDRKHRVIAEVFGLGRFVGVGRNKHSAKSTAAKRALRMLSVRAQTSAPNLENTTT